jgi:ribosomal protein S18 acetylase RimI-like enzyme
VIRLATPEDSRFVTDVGVATGMFPADDTAVTDGMMAAYFAGKRDEGHLCLIDETEPFGGGAAEQVAMAYIEPVRATDGTWELLMIAVDPRHQGAGRGSALVKHLEHTLAARGQRLLLVQTSGDHGYARTRAFYVRCGYEQGARLRDYYATGVDMVLFRKELLPVKHADHAPR